jgi:quercetin dioxygenase-like cupin family protein
MLETLRRFAIAAGAVLVTGLATASALAAEPAKVTPIAKTETTITGQPIVTPAGPHQVVASMVELPVGGRLAPHKHPYPRYVYVLSGHLRVTYFDAKLVKEFKAGDFAAEAVDQWHMGEQVGTEPVKLLVIDHVPAGQANVVMRPD